MTCVVRQAGLSSRPEKEKAPGDDRSQFENAVSRLSFSTSPGSMIFFADDTLADREKSVKRLGRPLAVGGEPDGIAPGLHEN